MHWIWASKWLKVFYSCCRVFPVSQSETSILNNQNKLPIEDCSHSNWWAHLLGCGYSDCVSINCKNETNSPSVCCCLATESLAIVHILGIPNCQAFTIQLTNIDTKKFELGSFGWQLFMVSQHAQPCTRAKFDFKLLVTLWGVLLFIGGLVIGFILGYFCTRKVVFWSLTWINPIRICLCSSDE